MTRSLQAAVVGGGIVGASVLYWLARLGWNEIALFEKSGLTSGSTWHAAGNVTFFGHYPSLTALYVNSVRAYLEAEQETGIAVDFRAPGSLRLATTKAELDWYCSLAPLYERLDAEYRIAAVDEIARLHPLLNTRGLAGAAHTPGDGHVDPCGATRALAAAARLRGAEIRESCPVAAVSRESWGWSFHADGEDWHARHIVVANSFWAREFLQPLGLVLPVYPVQHHEIVTDAVTRLADLDGDLPTVRDPWVPSNIRQEGNGFLFGIYERTPEFWSVEGIPSGFGTELLPPDLDRLEVHLQRQMQRIPELAEAGITTVINGPICYTPDGLPLLGPVKGMEGLWLATGFCVGIGTGGGSGAFLSRWMTDGVPPGGASPADPGRFDPQLTKRVCLERIRRAYAAGYSMPETA